MNKKYIYDNVMIAVSTATKNTLKKVKQNNCLKNMDDTIKFILSEAKVI